MKYFKAAVLAATLMSGTTAFAFDDNREGFILGLGLGIHSLKNDYSLNGASYLTESKSGLATSFKIGAGITNQFALYFVRNASWFNTTYASREVHAVAGISGIGATYFLEPAAPSVYVLGAVGGGDYAIPLESTFTTRTGGAVMLGGGYEFDKNVMFEITLLAAGVAEPANAQAKTQSSALQFTINYMFY
ncbi:MAG: hypothetical protein WC236_11815 [Gallionellaceae bacterium]|jgi:hypothetical protein